MRGQLNIALVLALVWTTSACNSEVSVMQRRTQNLYEEASAPFATPRPTLPQPSPTPIQTTNPGSKKSVTVSWQANREKAVNQPGGGYRVYYSTSPGFSITKAPSVNIPYVSGSQAPTQAVLSNLPSGAKTVYIKVVAYSALKRDGKGPGSESEPSDEVSVSIP